MFTSPITVCDVLIDIDEQKLQSSHCSWTSADLLGIHRQLIFDRTDDEEILSMGNETRTRAQSKADLDLLLNRTCSNGSLNSHDELIDLMNNALTEDDLRSVLFAPAHHYSSCQR